MEDSFCSVIGSSLVSMLGLLVSLCSRRSLHLDLGLAFCQSQGGRNIASSVWSHPVPLLLTIASSLPEFDALVDKDTLQSWRKQATNLGASTFFWMLLLSAPFEAQDPRQEKPGFWCLYPLFPLSLCLWHDLTLCLTSFSGKIFMSLPLDRLDTR